MEILLQAFVLGAIGGLVPGAVFTLLLVSVLQGGFKAGIKAFWWVLISEIIIAGGLLFIATQLPLKESFFISIGIIGGAVLLYFAYQVFQLRAVKVEEGNNIVFTPLKIFLLSATNSPLYIFWTTICFPLIWQLASTWGLSAAAVSYFVVFEIGWILTTFLTILVFAYARTILTNERLMHKVFIVIALILATFGLKMLVTSATFLFQAS